MSLIRNYQLLILNVAMSKRFTIYGRLQPIESASLEIPLQRFQSALFTLDNH